MAFCGNCGTQVQDGVKFCPSCGGQIGAAPAQQAQPGQRQQTGYIPPVVPGAPAQTDIRDVQDNKGMAIVAYILFFIPLLTGAHRNSTFVKYHTNQGTVLFIVCIAWGVAYWIITAIFTALLLHAATWGLWSVITTILSFLWLIPTILCEVGIINAVNGRYKPLPLIGGISIIK
jgi:uncharacterized membrane protein